MSEEFVAIDGWPGYSVDRLGNVKSSKRSFEAILKPTNNRYGYPYVKLMNKGFAKKYSIHRLVAIAFIPNPLNHLQVNHKDGNKQNNHVANLEWCDDRHNRDHAMKNNLIPRGTNVASTVLNDKCAIAIKNLLADGFKQEYIASIFEVSKSAVNYMSIGWKGASPKRRPLKNRAHIKPTSKAVCLINEQGKPQRYFKSAQQAGRDLGLAATLILHVANGRQTETKGHRFVFAEDVKQINT